MGSEKDSTAFATGTLFPLFYWVWIIKAQKVKKIIFKQVPFTFVHKQQIKSHICGVMSSERLHKTDTERHKMTTKRYKTTTNTQNDSKEIQNEYKYIKKYSKMTQKD